MRAGVSDKVHRVFDEGWHTVEAWVLRPQESKDHFKVTEGVFTFVALDDKGKKRPVPPE